MSSFELQEKRRSLELFSKAIEEMRAAIVELLSLTEASFSKPANDALARLHQAWDSMDTAYETSRQLSVQDGATETTPFETQKVNANGDHMEETLRQALEKASQDLDSATQAFQKAVRDVPTGLPASDGVSLIQQAGSRQQAARTSFELASQRLHDFITQNSVPYRT